MPSLDWIGKSAVKNHHKEVPFRLLNCRADLSVGDPNSGNLIVQGDNLEALKALLPYYAGQVKCIYIRLITQGMKGGSTTTLSTAQKCVIGWAVWWAAKPKI